MEKRIDFLGELTEAELIFRKFYYASKTEAGFLKLLDETEDQNLKNRFKGWYDAQKGLIYSEMTEFNMDLALHDCVDVRLHHRYTPKFFHKHTFYEIVYVNKGDFINNFTGHSFKMTAGDFCLIRPGCYHSVEECKESEIINILIKNYALNDILYNFMRSDNAISAFLQNSLFSEDNPEYLLIRTGEDPDIISFMNRFLSEIFVRSREEFDCRGVDFNLLKEAYLNMLLVYLVPFCRNMDKLIIRNSDKFIDIQKYIYSDLQNASLEDYARISGLSVSYVSRNIRAVTGMNFSAILKRIRVCRACELLSETKLTVSEIASQLGYSGARQFNRIFMSIIHMTPTEYRRKGISLT